MGFWNSCRQWHFKAVALYKLILNGFMCMILASSYGFAEDYLPLRIKAYKEMLSSLQHALLDEKLIKINTFFNQFVSDYDANVWHKEDYWATPLEFMAKGRGDCEDYTIGKYFALKDARVNPDKLFVFIVKEQTAKDFHMVLAYIDNASAEPRILDNLSWKILPLVQRTDLTLIYGFNEKYLYLNGKTAPLNDAFIKSHPEIMSWFEVIKKVNNKKIAP